MRNPAIPKRLQVLLVDPSSLVDNLRMKLIACALLALSCVSAAPAQQIGVVDFTQPEPPPTPEQQKETLFPPNCVGPGGILYNGVVKGNDNQPQAISLEIVKLSSQKFEVNTAVRAEIRLKNTGRQPITIPWSTDPGVVEKTLDPDHLVWEQANFQVVLLRDKQGRTIALNSAKSSLYGTKQVAGSLLTINTGEWITAFINFNVEDLYHIVSSEDFPIGESRVFLEWEQEARQWDREKCGWNRGWFDHLYKQEHPAVTVEVNRTRSKESPDVK